MKNLIYTFRTFPFIDELNKMSDDVFVLDKIKNDLKQICSKIELENPSMIIGIAKSETEESTIEAITINDFHKINKVKKELSIKELPMDLPKNCIFKVRNKPTNSFCNYSMFSIKSFLIVNKLDPSFIFIHITKEDMEKLPKLF